MARKQREMYPDYTAELQALHKDGVSPEILHHILNKHRWRAGYDKALHERYMCMDGAVPIMKRKAKYKNSLNNKLWTDFFGEGVDFKTGYFAGTPVAYSYAKGVDISEIVGGEATVKAAAKVLSDFVRRSVMYLVDMETTKYAAISGYAGRLVYIDTDKQERVMAIQGYETIILSSTNIAEPEYGIRYYETETLTGMKEWTVIVYDDAYKYVYKGSKNDLKLKSKELHMFDYCPLQGVPNNAELMGDMEKVVSLIDDYDKILSDNSNEIEAFVHAMIVYENLQVDEKTAKDAQTSGSLQFRSAGTQQGKVYYLTKDINDAFTEHHLERLKDNIYRTSRTPNLDDEAFGSASGVSLKFKLNGHESKCGAFQAWMEKAGSHMWKVLTSSWKRNYGVEIDPLLIEMQFTRNFPQDELEAAQIVQALRAAGVPFEVAVSRLPFVKDPHQLKEMADAEMDDIPPLEEDNEEDEEEDSEE